MRWLLLLPALLVLILFALSNQDPVTLRLWPLEGSVEALQSVAIMVIAAAAFLCGALVAWFASLPDRARADRVARSAAVMEAELAELRARTPRPVGQKLASLPRLQRPAA
jgi:lipopolysaccharide assembly protein A